MEKRMYNLREKRLVEYIGAKRMTDIVIGVRKEIERYRLDALPIQVYSSSCVCVRCGNAEHVSQVRYCKICGIELFLTRTE
ncbi:hypothetical protein COC69_00030 [Bacillus cereus]|uniref:Uncharacterized protein n=1 Tax=Bacillus cereus TaxID=1396 RepID=A0A9X7CT14_BACCE|nr:hypothetical protein [Bacillus cereus]PGS84586.1 hypothetical protein COC69_00030 [Bacillus cereus]